MRSKLTTLTCIAAVVILTVAMLSCVHEPNDVVPTVSFQKDIQPILKSSCALNSSCHSGATNKGDNMNFDSSAAYTTISTKGLVKTDNATASLLYVELASGIMPKAPNSLLSSSQILLFKYWIQQGAQNN